MFPASLFPVSAKSFARHRKPIGIAANSTLTTTANTRSARLHFFQSATKSRIALPSAAPGPLWQYLGGPVETPVSGA
jgi:hypothetical protein